MVIRTNININMNINNNIIITIYIIMIIIIVIIYKLQIAYTSRFVRIILAQGPRNLLCIVPISTDDPRRESRVLCLLCYVVVANFC